MASYASSDALPTNGNANGCESTSAQSLANYLTDLYKSLDENAIVGGRIDPVVHSMGGLAVRNFSNSAASLYAYRNTRNRNQGTFRDVVTLDTPETGSSIAYYLNYVFADRTVDISNVLDPSISGAVWIFRCGLNPLKTVRQCMDENQQPLGYPDHDLREGAVYSLIPDMINPTGQAQFGSLANPNIPNATWYAVASNQHDGGSLLSPLEVGLNYFISATYPASQQSPTITSMLGTTANDVIVRTDSQTAGVIPEQTRTFPGLAHTSIGGSFTSYLHSLGILTSVDASVTTSDAVNATVSYWLGYRAFPAAQQSPAAHSQAEGSTGLHLSPMNLGKPMFEADERLAARMPNGPVELAQPVEIPIDFTDGNLSFLDVSQRYGTKRIENKRSGRDLGSGTPKVLRDDGLTKTIEITPLHPGTIEVEIVAIFADGAICRK